MLGSPPRDVTCQTRTLAAPGADATALLELAHLHAHFGERDAAARRAAQAAEVFARQGAQNALRQVQPLAASLQQR